MRLEVNCGASSLFFPFLFPKLSFRFDCDLNQWNLCEEFNFVEHGTSVEDDDEEDVEMVPIAENIRNNDPLQLDEDRLGLLDPEDNGGIPLAHICQQPFFSNQSVVNFLADLPSQASSQDIADWRDAEDFLAKRYGLTDQLGKEDKTKRNPWSKRLGFNIEFPDEYAVQLYSSVLENSWPPLICDLSEDIVSTPEVFPSSNSNNILSVSESSFGYVVEVKDGETRPWKLLIKDPLSVLQLERELWCLDGNRLIINLVKKGIPFEVLHTTCHERGPFVDHPGPELHPAEKEPCLADYFAYRHDLVDFLQRYPHAHAAALCTGGILWRVVVDVLPLPSENAMVGPFHKDVCISRMVNGVKYWTPRLTDKEEHVLVGVYRWAESE